MLSYQWQDRTFKIDSLNSRRPVEPADELVVIACPDPPGAEDCLKAVRLVRRFGFGGVGVVCAVAVVCVQYRARVCVQGVCMYCREVFAASAVTHPPARSDDSGRRPGREGGHPRAPRDPLQPAAVEVGCAGSVGTPFHAPNHLAPALPSQPPTTGAISPHQTTPTPPLPQPNPNPPSGDVGIGLNARRLRTNFLNRFTVTYSLRPVGDIGTVFRKYPGMWKVFVEEPGLPGRCVRLTGFDRGFLLLGWRGLK
jgi:hypothetical protein